jgi:ribosomal protein S18 acetylase RimI-like enzyme
MINELHGLIRLNQNDITQAAEVLAKAFQEYPLIAHFIPDASKRLKTQARAFQTLLKDGIKYGEVYATSPKLEAVAVWYWPENPPNPRKRTPFFSRIGASLFSDRERSKKERIFQEYANVVRQRAVPGQHAYLQILGIYPAYQGQGYAGGLLRPMLMRADREGLQCFLETQSAKNVALYEHFGFRVVEVGIIPGSDIKSWAMVRG